MMDIASKLRILDQIYAIYDSFAASLDRACQKHCDHCCTSGVTLTTLEGYKITDRLRLETDSDVIQKIDAALIKKRFRPRMTTNRLAQLCAEGIDPPEESGHLDLQACPLLFDRQCPIYALRPYGCRCLISRHNCGEKGYAEIDDYALSVNTVFLQTIEHVDADGCSGNLVDVLKTMSSEQNQAAYCSGTLHCSANSLISNHPLEVLMIPPEHRTRMKPILQELRQVKR
jgi:hypothetical protein